MSQLNVLTAQLSDLDAIAEIERSVHLAPWSNQLLSDSLQQHLCWKLQSGESLVGYLVVMRVMEQAEILNIAVAKAYQGQGLARHLLEYLKDYAQKQGITSLFLEVRESNSAARKLYEKFGFVAVGLRKNYYQTPLGRENALLMQLS